MPRLLAEGHEGKAALVKGTRIVGLYPTHDEAVQAGYTRFSWETFLVHEVQKEVQPRDARAEVPRTASSGTSLRQEAAQTSQPFRRTIHYTEVPELPPEHPRYHEGNALRRELPRLLAEGHEGKFALVKGHALVGLYPTDEEATRAGYAKFLPEGFLVQEIRAEEPLLHLSPHCRQCHT